MTQLAYYMRRVRELGFRESARQAKTIVAERASSRFSSIRDRYFSSTEQDDAERLIKSVFRQRNIVAQLKTRSAPHFFLDHEPEFYRDAIRSHFPDEGPKIIRAADRIKERRFDLLGSGPKYLPDLPWHVDFKSGFAWEPAQHYREVRYGNVPGVDVKLPWELSRFQHAILLGQAYWLTGSEAYATEFKNQFLDWIERNPCKYGVNWACTMDVGIRAVNWIWAFYFFRRSPSVDSQFLKVFLRGLYDHASFIRSNLEYRTAVIDGRERRLNSNHYLSNVIGLLYIGLLFPELELQKDVDFAKDELCMEIFEQTYPDGVDYEHSTFYHRFVAEIFLSGFLLLKRNGHTLSSNVEGRLQAMGAYIADYLRPDGTAPQIGDADNGRLHPLAIRSMADHRYIPTILAEIYSREDLRICDGDIEALWWIGAAPSRGNDSPRRSASYANHKFSILRSNRAHVFVSAAPICMHGLGSHSHNDILSFEYWSQGRAWIVDPGTYIYTPAPASRNYFRSTEAHNTIRIDKTEINPFFPERLFQLPDHAQVKCHEWRDTEDFTEIVAEHNGYDVTHRRRFRFNKYTDDLEIQDILAGTGSHEFEWFFHLSPGTNVEVKNGALILRCGSNAITLHCDDKTVPWENTDGWYSPSYGVREPVPVIVRRMRASAPLQFTTWIINRYAPDFRHQ